MAVHHLTVTLNGSAQALSTPSAGSPSVNVQELQIESESGNGTVYVGGSGVSATDYGRSITAGTANAITLRTPNGRSINLASTYVIGTNAQKIHILYTS